MGKAIDGNTIGLLAACVIIGLSTIVISTFSGGLAWDVWPHEWDTVIVGFTAVVAAFFSVRAIRQQMNQERDHREDDLRRQAYAARAVLPLALAALNRYAQGCIDQLISALNLDPQALSTHNFDFPVLPSDLVQPIQDCVRFANGGKQEELADLIAELQVQHSRLIEFAHPTPGLLRLRFTLIDYCCDSIELSGRISALYDYGRRKPDGEIQGLVGVAMICGVVHGMYDEVDQRVALAAQRYLNELTSYRL